MGDGLPQGADTSRGLVRWRQIIDRFGLGDATTEVDLLERIPAASDTGFTLPFGDGTIDRVMVGPPVTQRIRPGEWVSEVSRILTNDGELVVVFGVDRKGHAGEPLEEASPALDYLHQEYRLTDWLLAPTAVAMRFGRACSSTDEPAVSLASLAPALVSELERVWRRVTALEVSLENAGVELAAQEREWAAERSTLVGTIGTLELSLADAETRRDEQRLLAASQASAIRDATTELRRQTPTGIGGSRVRGTSPSVVGLSRKLDQTEYKLQRTRWQLEVHKRRKWTLLGQELGRARRRPRRAVALPLRAARILAGPSVRPVEPERPATSESKKSSSTLKEPSVQQFPIPPAVPRRTDIRMATIVDEFSELAFRYECELMPCRRTGWREQLGRDRPDFLFVESAWNANGGEWRHTMARREGPHEDLVELVKWCRDQGITTVFWNKEDPLEYDLFLPTARLFDWVFTVDANRLEPYRTALGHDQVRVLPFAVQPALHNPIGSFGDRPGAVAFAGTNYAGKYPERQHQLEQVVAPCTTLGLDIFSRFESDPKYRFPYPLSECVVGSLNYPQMLTAYRRYKVFLNVNSVVDSPTMFARRVLELLACGTPVVSGPSIGMQRMLGDAVWISEDEATTRRTAKALLRSPETRDRSAVVGLRAVFSGNRYSDRVETMLGAIRGGQSTDGPTISVLGPTNKPGGWKRTLASVARQSFPEIELVVLLHGVDEDDSAVRATAAELGVDHVSIVRLSSELSLGEVLNAGVENSSGQYVAKFDDDDLYGPNYLSDQLLAFSYTEAEVVGKWTRFVSFESDSSLGVLFPGYEHRYTQLVGGGTILARREVVESIRFPAVTRGEDTGFLRAAGAEGVRIYSTDRFNFVYTRHSDSTLHTYSIADEEHLASTQIVAYGVDPERHAFV